MFFNYNIGGLSQNRQSGKTVRGNRYYVGTIMLQHRCSEKQAEGTVHSNIGDPWVDHPLQEGTIYIIIDGPGEPSMMTEMVQRDHPCRHKQSGGTVFEGGPIIA